MNYEQELRALHNPKTKKPVRVQHYVNDWLCQVIVENKRWSTVYHSATPRGVPDFVASSIEEAKLLTFKAAYEDAVLWLPTLLQKSDTQDRDSF